MNFETTSDAKVQSVRCCVLFDPSDGSVHHVHRVVTMVGAHDTSENEMEARTLELAKKRGLDTSRLRALHVDPHAIARGPQKVDLATRSLVTYKKS